MHCWTPCLGSGTTGFFFLEMNVGYLQKRHRKNWNLRSTFIIFFLTLHCCSFSMNSCFTATVFILISLKASKAFSLMCSSDLYLVHTETYVFLCNKCFLILHIFNKFSRLYFCPLCMFHIALTYFPLSHWHVQLNSCSEMSESCTKRL